MNMEALTKNTIFWATFWGLFVVGSIAAAVVIPKANRAADDEVRQAQIERAQTERELQELMEQRMQREQMDQQEMIPKTPDQIRIADVDALVEALEAYYREEFVYPIASGEGGALVEVEPRRPPCFELVAEALLETCPRDPLWPERSYRYRSELGFGYEATALLDGDDPSACTYIGDLCIYVVSGGAPQTQEASPESDSETGEEEIGASLYDAISSAYTTRY